MSDDQPDPGTDPLSGRDPYPRDQIDLWPLHDARHELLEEIVSQAGESPARSARSRVLLSTVGIAAALALVVGGAWAVTNDGSDGSDGGGGEAQVAASSGASTPSEEASDPTAPATETAATETAEPTKEPTKERDVRRKGVHVGDVRSLRECLVDLKRDGVRLRKGAPTRLDKVVKRGKHKWVLYVVRDGERRATVLDSGCKGIRFVPERPRRR